MGDVVVGTCSWADKTMVERWYPHGVNTAEARLRYYAARFDAVEVDSTFYALPRPETVEHWAARTPPGFTFHVKAYGLMTGHEVDERSLHPELRDFDYELTPRGRVRRPDDRMYERAFELFLECIEPLRRSHKMGGVLVQYPPSFQASDPLQVARNLETIERAAELLEPLPVFVEFRHSSWVGGAQRARTMRFLADRFLTYVSVDEPQVPSAHTMPPITTATSPFGYVRFHGRNVSAWASQTASVAERFDYLYSPDELAEWRTPIRDLAGQTERTWVMFNNHTYDYAPRNAREMAEVLGDVVAPRLSGAGETGEPASGDGNPLGDGSAGRLF